MFKEAALVGIKIPFFVKAALQHVSFESLEQQQNIQQNIVFIFTVLSSIFQGLYLKDFNTHTARKKKLQLSLCVFYLYPGW